jgi:hypothetical protein
MDRRSCRLRGRDFSLAPAAATTRRRATSVPTDDGSGLATTGSGRWAPGSGHAGAATALPAAVPSDLQRPRPLDDERGEDAAPLPPSSRAAQASSGRLRRWRKDGEWGRGRQRCLGASACVALRGDDAGALSYAAHSKM